MVSSKATDVHRPALPTGIPPPGRGAAAAPRHTRRPHTRSGRPATDPRCQPCGPDGTVRQPSGRCIRTSTWTPGSSPQGNVGHRFAAPPSRSGARAVCPPSSPWRGSGWPPGVGAGKRRCGGTHGRGLFRMRSATEGPVSWPGRAAWQPTRSPDLQKRAGCQGPKTVKEWNGLPAQAGTFCPHRGQGRNPWGDAMDWWAAGRSRAVPLGKRISGE